MFGHIDRVNLKGGGHAIKDIILMLSIGDWKKSVVMSGSYLGSSLFRTINQISACCFDKT